MKYLDVNMPGSKGKNGRYIISNHDYMIDSNHVLHAFTVYWPEGPVGRLALNSREQAPSSWLGDFRTLIDGSLSPKSTKRIREWIDEALSLKGMVGIGGTSGLIPGGPKGGVIGAGAGVLISLLFKDVIKEKLDDLLNKLQADEKLKKGYYDLQTGEYSLDFPEPIHRDRITVNFETDVLRFE